MNYNKVVIIPRSYLLPLDIRPPLHLTLLKWGYVLVVGGVVLYKILRSLAQ